MLKCKCKICNGSGTLAIANDSEYDEGFCDCGNCGGTGIVKKKSTSRITRTTGGREMLKCNCGHELNTIFEFKYSKGKLYLCNFCGEVYRDGGVIKSISSDAMLSEIRAALLHGIEAQENHRHDECLLHINMALVKLTSQYNEQCQCDGEIPNSERESLRTKFEKEFGIPWINEQGEPDLDYVHWLEDIIIKEIK